MFDNACKSPIVPRMSHALSHRFRSRWRKFFSYYKPHRTLLIADIFCSLLRAATTLAFPILANLLTKQLLDPGEASHIVHSLVLWGGLMLSLTALQAACMFFIDYRGHIMGASMEGEIRRELFAHCQKMSFRFYDDQRVGQLMSRITHDLPVSYTHLTLPTKA